MCEFEQFYLWNKICLFLWNTCIFNHCDLIWFFFFGNINVNYVDNKQKLNHWHFFFFFFCILSLTDAVPPPCHALSLAPQRFTLAHQAPRGRLLLAASCGGSVKGKGAGWQMVQWYMYVWLTEWLKDQLMDDALTLSFLCCLVSSAALHFVTFPWPATWLCVVMKG